MLQGDLLKDLQAKEIRELETGEGMTLAIIKVITQTNLSHRHTIVWKITKNLVENHSILLSADYSVV